jgi:hypothetical protein
MRGRVLALQAMVFLGSTPIGGPLLGRICDTYGARAGLLVGGVACFVAAGWGIFATRGGRHLAPADAGGLDVLVGRPVEQSPLPTLSSAT